MFKYGEELRLLGYSGFNLDWLGRATRFQPIAIAGGEVYPIKTLEDCVKYQENVLSNNVGFSSYSYITDDIDNYITILNALDNAVVLNSKQIYLPFIAKVFGSQQATQLKTLLANIFGKDFENMIIEVKPTDDGGTQIQTTNMQVFLQQIQDTKKKILDEVFFYLGVSSPQGKLAHQSEIEIESANAVVDLLDKIMYFKIEEFLDKCNKMFGCDMKIVKYI